jgi:hypothetical protein
MVASGRLFLEPLAALPVLVAAKFGLRYDRASIVDGDRLCSPLWRPSRQRGDTPIAATLYDNTTKTLVQMLVASHRHRFSLNAISSSPVRLVTSGARVTDVTYVKLEMPETLLCRVPGTQLNITSYYT